MILTTILDCVCGGFVFSNSAIALAFHGKLYIETLVLHGPYLSILSSPEAMILKFGFYMPSKTGNNFRGRINFVKKICHEFCPWIYLKGHLGYLSYIKCWGGGDKKIQIDFIERLLTASAPLSVMPNKLFPDAYCLTKSFMFIMYFLNKDPGSQPATGGALP